MAVSSPPPPMDSVELVERPNGPLPPMPSPSQSAKCAGNLFADEEEAVVAVNAWVAAALGLDDNNCKRLGLAGTRLTGTAFGFMRVSGRISSKVLRNSIMTDIL